MKKLTFAALFCAVSIRAQDNPPSQTPSPTSSEKATKAAQAPAVPTVKPESTPWEQEARKRLEELGYIEVAANLGTVKKPATVQPVTPCAIPLATVPLPDKNGFAIRTAPANPSVDPRIVQSPPLPACVQKTPMIVERPLVLPAPEKK